MNKRLQEAKYDHEMREEEWRTFLDECDDMLFDEDYDFAVDVIQGIRDWVAENKLVTLKQKEAIKNIRNAVEERDW